jgi:hypothetical protein
MKKREKCNTTQNKYYCYTINNIVIKYYYFIKEKKTKIKQEKVVYFLSNLMVKKSIK